MELAPNPQAMFCPPNESQVVATVEYGPHASPVNSETSWKVPPAQMENVYLPEAAGVKASQVDPERAKPAKHTVDRTSAASGVPASSFKAIV
jgi:hypothetical protein